MNNTDVQEEILILNVMKYDNDKGSGCRVSFILTEKGQDTKNFVGHPVIDQFYNDKSVFNKVKDYVLEGVIASFTVVPNANNPLRTRSILSKIESNETTINLL